MQKGEKLKEKNGIDWDWQRKRTMENPTINSFALKQGQIAYKPEQILIKS